MSNKSKSFGGLLNSLQDGLSKINKDAKEKAEGTEAHMPEEDNREAGDEGSFEHEKDQGEDRPFINDHYQEIDDGIIIESELIEPKPKSGLAAMSTKQKVVIVLGFIAIAFAAKTTLLAPEQTTTQSPDLVQTDGSGYNAEPATEPAFGFDEPMGDQAVGFDTSTEFNESEYGVSDFHSPASPSDSPNALMGDALDIASMDRELSLLAGDEPQMLDPFSKEVVVEPPANPLSAGPQAAEIDGRLVFNDEAAYSGERDRSFRGS